MSTTRLPQPQSIDAVRDWYEAMTESVLAHRAAALVDARAGRLTTGSRFFGMTLDEMEAVFAGQRVELDLLTVLALVASAEAALRADYADRLRRGRSDPLSKAYAALHRELGGHARPALDEHILVTLKAAGVLPNHLVGDFRDALGLRHWLAHGRYWTLSLGRNSYAPDDVYRTIDALLTALPA